MQSSLSNGEKASHLFNGRACEKRMRVELLEDLDNEDNRGITSWRDILDEIYRTDGAGVRSPARQDFVDSHATTIRYLSAADYHYHNLKQVYVPDVTPISSLTTIWAQIETESVIVTLYGALDSLMQEVNLAYKFGIDENKVYANHGSGHRGNPRADCVRCRLTSLNDSLSNHIDTELSSDWFDKFRRLRNRLTHRQLLATNTNLGQSTVYIEMPTNPEASRFTEEPRRGIEISAYCEARRRNVADLLSSTYGMLVTKIRDI